MYIHYYKHTNKQENYAILPNLITYRLSRRDFTGENFRNAKISNFEYRLLFVEHDILSLEVSVKNILRMDVLYGHQYLDKELEYVLE